MKSVPLTHIRQTPKSPGPRKMAHTLVTPSMSREQIKRNIIDALTKSGFKMLPPENMKTNGKH